MTYIRRNLRFRNSIRLRSEEIFCAILIFFLSSFFSLVAFSSGRDYAFAEQDLYLALQGRPIAGEKIAATAAIAKEIYEKKGIVFRGYEDWQKIQATGTAVRETNKVGSLIFALENWDKVVRAIKNPADEIAVEIPAWASFFKTIGLIGFIILSISLSMGYCLNDKARGERWWQYPWNKWWAYPMALALFPYIIITQPMVAIYALVGEARGDNALERRISRDERISGERAAKEYLEIKIASMVEKTALFRPAWIELQNKNAWQIEKDGLKTAIAQRQQELAGLGHDIEKAQRALADDRNNLLEVVKMQKEETAKRNAEKMSREFDELLRLPGLKALEITGAEIRLYTDIIERYHVGNFLIRIDTRTGSVKIENMATDTMIHFCFGDYAQTIKKNVREKNYLPVAAYVLRAVREG